MIFDKLQHQYWTFKKTRNPFVVIKNKQGLRRPSKNINRLDSSSVMCIIKMQVTPGWGLWVSPSHWDWVVACGEVHCQSQFGHNTYAYSLVSVVTLSNVSAIFFNKTEIDFKKILCYVKIFSLLYRHDWFHWEIVVYWETAEDYTARIIAEDCSLNREGA